MTKQTVQVILNSLNPNKRLDLVNLLDNQEFMNLYKQELILTGQPATDATYLIIGLEYLEAMQG